MKEIIGISAVLAMTILAVNVLAGTGGPASITASATVQPVCGISATDIVFGTVVPSSTVSDKTSTISMPIGNTQTTSLTIKGEDWSDGGSNSMPVTQTMWKSSGSYTALETTESASIGQVSFGTPLTVNFQLSVPAGQAAASYTQTITFTASCDD